jgi:hypothetical protein
MRPVTQRRLTHLAVLACCALMVAVIGCLSTKPGPAAATSPAPASSTGSSAVISGPFLGVAATSRLEGQYSTQPGPTCTRSETMVIYDRVTGFLDGAPDPVAAARRHSSGGSDSASSWRVVGAASTRDATTAVTVTDGTSYLVASELSNHTWVISSTGRCTD